MDAAALIDKFLQFGEDRKIEEMQAMMAPQSRIEFPGGKLFSTQTEMVANAKGIKKFYTSVLCLSFSN